MQSPLTPLSPINSAFTFRMGLHNRVSVELAPPNHSPIVVERGNRLRGSDADYDTDSDMIIVNAKHFENRQAGRRHTYNAPSRSVVPRVQDVRDRVKSDPVTQQSHHSQLHKNVNRLATENHLADRGFSKKYIKRSLSVYEVRSL